MKTKLSFLAGSKALPFKKKKVAAICSASLLAAALFAVPAISRADTLDITGFWSGSVGTTITSPVSIGTSAGGFATLDTTTSMTFQSWCADIHHTLSFNTPYPNFSGPVAASTFFTPTIATDLARLATLHSPVVTGAMNSILSTDEAAFQLAVWEIIFETPNTTYNVLLNNFKVSSNASTTQANTWLTAVSNYSGGLAYTAEIWSSGPIGHQETQNLLVFQPVPEPETYAMILAGLGLMGFVARRRRSTGDFS